MCSYWVLLFCDILTVYVISSDKDGYPMKWCTVKQIIFTGYFLYLQKNKIKWGKKTIIIIIFK